MILKVKNIEKSFQQGANEISILKGLELEANKGDLIAILGQSGSGKSTLLSLLACLDRPDRGEIEIIGQNVTSLTEQQRTRFRGENIGIVFQEFHLIPHLTALQNVLLPMEIQKKEHSKETAMELLIQMGLRDRKSHYPSQLSGGECQRVAIARALATNPALILADEPSGNLDYATGESVMNIFFETVRKNNCTVLLVTHSNNLAARCDKSYLLSNGKLIPANVNY